MSKVNSIENLERYHGHFNYPAFLFSWIYLFFNGKKLLAVILFLFTLSSPFTLPFLAMFIGPAAFLMPLIIVNVFSSAIGNKTAWEFNNCKSYEDFRKSQKVWKTSALVITIISIFGFVYLSTVV